MIVRNLSHFVIALMLFGAATSNAGTFGYKGHAGTRPPPRQVLTGTVELGGEPSVGWRVTLYAAGAHAARALGNATTHGDGDFKIRWKAPANNQVLYAIASRGDGFDLMAVLGTADDLPDAVVVNERTTVASVWTSAQFLEGHDLSGNAVGLRSAAANVPNLVDLPTGEPGTVVQNSVNGTATTVLAAFNSLATILFDCVSTQSCAGFYAAATLPGEPAPDGTLQALLNIARNPGNNVGALFDLVPGPGDDPAFVPSLVYPPTAWTLSLVYTGGGLAAPGGISIARDGSVWTNNNFVPGSQSHLAPALPSYPGTGVSHLTSNGTPISPITGYQGGGLYGAAFGIAIDRRDHIWVGNFAGDSVSELMPDGTPLSPDSVPTFSSTGGYKASATFSSPQSVVVDRDDNIWVTNLTNGTVTELVGGNPNNVRTAPGTSCPNGFTNPWGMAVDQDGNVWVTNEGGNSVSRIDPSVDPLCPGPQIPVTTSGPLARPQGVAVDSQGNLWVADTNGDRISLLRAPSYDSPEIFTGGGSVAGSFGIAVDGADNVWVPNFFGQSLVNLCGVPENCPGGLTTGDAISSLPTGYGGGGGLQRLTSVVIDQAGNVWVANNNIRDAVCFGAEGVTPPGGVTDAPTERLSTQCGGNGVVAFFGIAAPVAAPLIGPPRQPFDRDGRKPHRHGYR